MKHNLVFTILAILTIFAVFGCGTTRPTTTTTQVVYQYRDSLVIHRDTVTLEVPIETASAFNVQHSHLETLVATSEASVDSTGLLSHTLTNKPFKVEKEIVYVDHKVVEYRDSLVTKEVPVEVEVVKTVTPRWAWRLVVVDFVLLVVLGAWVYLKLKLKH